MIHIDIIKSNVSKDILVVCKDCSKILIGSIGGMKGANLYFRKLGLKD